MKACYSAPFKTSPPEPKKEASGHTANSLPSEGISYQDPNSKGPPQHPLSLLAKQVLTIETKGSLGESFRDIYIFIYIYIYIYRYIYIYVCSRPPPMIHPNLLFLSSGSWEVGSLGCENIGRDQTSPKFLKPEMRKHRQFPKLPKI